MSQGRRRCEVIYQKEKKGRGLDELALLMAATDDKRRSRFGRRRRNQSSRAVRRLFGKRGGREEKGRRKRESNLVRSSAHCSGHGGRRKERNLKLSTPAGKKRERSFGSEYDRERRKRKICGKKKEEE